MPKPASFIKNPNFYKDLAKELYNLDDISIESVNIGIQNYNFFIKNAKGDNTHFLSIKRYGQGEIQDESHQGKLLQIQLKLYEKGIKLARPIAGQTKLLQTIPDTINGQATPKDIAGSHIVLYEFLHGKSVNAKTATLQDFKDMGIQHGLFLQKSREILRENPDLQTLQNPVSFEHLSKMLVTAFGYPEDRSIDSILENPEELAKQKVKIIKNLRGKLKQYDNKNSTSTKLVNDFISRIENHWYSEILISYQEDLEIYNKLTSNMPKELLHGDMHFGNQFEKQGGIFDFDWMGVGHAFLDFCQPLVLNARQEDNNEDLHFSPEKAAAYFDGLQQNRPLTEFESQNLNKFIELTHWRSTATRLQSMINSAQIGDITKSPIELTDLRAKFAEEHSNTDILALITTKPKFLQNALEGSNIARY
jgi:hypothetical protein